MQYDSAPDTPVMFECESCGEAVPRAHTVCRRDGMRMCWFCCGELADDFDDEVIWDDDEDFDDDFDDEF